MSSNTEFVIVPGAWHGPESFDRTTTLLEKAGYTVHGISLPSVGAKPPLKSFQPDADVIQAKVKSVLSSGKDVVLVYHSYGSAPGGEALAEYVKELAAAAPKNPSQGKIQRLVFIASFIIPEGASLMAGLEKEPQRWLQVNGDEVTPSNPESSFYNDLDAATARKYAATLKPHSYQAFSSKLTVAPWKVIPSTYIVCENDNTIRVGIQEAMIGMAKDMSPNSFDVIERCDAGHSPFISQPEWLTEKLIKAATKGDQNLLKL